MDGGAIAGLGRAGGGTGWKVCGGFRATAEIAEMFDAYCAVAAAHGHPHGPDRLAVRRLVTFVDAPDRQREGMHTATEPAELEEAHRVFADEVIPVLHGAELRPD